MLHGLVIDKEGTKRWYDQDKLHREDGPAIEYVNGDKLWFRQDKLHREDGPAVECSSAPHKGNKYWWLNGERHREDGPAIEYGTGDKNWYYNGKQIKCSSQEEFEKIIKIKKSMVT